MNTATTAEPGDLTALPLDTENGTPRRGTPEGFMTPMEFAALPCEVHHAVWAAFNAGLLDTHPPKESTSGNPRRYRLDQVQAIQRAVTGPPPQESPILLLVTP